MSELPAGWVEVEIGDLCELVNGRAFKPQEWCKEGLPIIRIQNLNRPDAAFNFFKGELDPRHFVVTGQLLFAWSGTPGTSFGAHVWNGPSAALNQHIFKIEFDTEQVDKTFFRHAINQKLDELIGSAQGGVGLRHVTKGTFERTQITLPPLVEQKRIAQKLDALLAQVDTLKARIDAIPALLKRFRQSTLAAAFSARLTGEAPAEFDHWQEAKFSSVIEDLRYGTAQKCDYNGGTTGVLRIPNIGDRGIVLSDMKSSDFSETEIKKLELMKGDIVLIRSNGSVELVGKSALVSEKEQGLLFAGYLIRVRLDQAKSIPEFVNYWLKSPAIRQVIEQIARSTSGVNNINSEEIKSLTFTFPSLSAQAEIVRRVEQLFAYADQLEAKVAAAQQRIDALTQSLLAKAFRGELVPQDPTDEPASVLLARIRTQRAATPKPKRGRKKV
ncbi:restriction endonuclease subunit S [Xanthomonas euvesicatoria]|uniref:restriction endonuclease subunit S n=1 Tax=Xanthomonas euvesicatoria TaxID=456327 RepID=UPI001C47004C|nr:restriction endonuclease subunit S [Xanthomonas campestris pv. clerodendri]